MVATFALILWGVRSLQHLSIDAVPDITNNQVQILTTTRNLSTLDVEEFITYPIELEMANLPGIEEIRSVSKFGLSVVTIVFKESMGTFLPRQLIAEKIKSATEKIPAGFGSPEMGPISTGLGEIYQYILDTEPGYKDKYSDMDLRTIQDWIVKRQLSGINGVVEINTWGGHLKQYEVAIAPERLKSMNISIREVMEALEKNNSLTGAGYIEKNNKSYFIRADGLLNSKEAIEKIVVKKVGNQPILISDIAKVQFGHAPRFGAITGNGEGEKVMGQVMLLKDANTSEVLKSVKARVATIQKSLPEGVFINPFLERSELLAKTTNTVAENLIFGALIVIFVVVLLLGHFRSGLLIASIIPLALLFALGMMRVFGISANLMSLGAIDFGIIIDGAIIIVEFILFSLTIKMNELTGLGKEEFKVAKDQLVIESSTKMMKSAFFGQIIILIVFIPILALEGVEGKMFKPMAMTFGFALVGAIILCLTYVPAMASIFLKPDSKRLRISEKIIHGIFKLYSPVIEWVMKFKKGVLTLAVLFFVVCIYIFSTMGGEFIPTLDEGDLVIQPSIQTGTSLEKTIEICTHIEHILKEEFTEVKQVITRIGAAEVPTDPMGMEEVDVIVTLKPVREWGIAKNKDDLIDKISERLSQLPGIGLEFTQPIEMRFNELISGARADVAVKIYGENLDLLYAKAQEAQTFISTIDGAKDVTIEKVEGIPQLLIQYNRGRIAQYGLQIDEINQQVQMAFSGISAGLVYEGEKRFDLVMRYEEKYRSEAQQLGQIMITLDNGQQVPLAEVAEIQTVTSPAKISRDNTKRRVSIGVNVRNRDMESVVNDIQGVLEAKLDLPPGYEIEYGGQFENLNNARNRLLLVVPLALGLILLLLYITFKSVTEAVLIFSAIPMAATGGILLLWIRGMPFSISAGIGFIALFGIAVLNGIVLIEHYKSLKIANFSSIKKLIIDGTKHRILPVLLTAFAAGLGFLPMAISQSSGAEVQRPLATAVIGGLVTSTLLTLILLPILYSWVLERKKAKGLLVLLPLFFVFGANGQEMVKPIGLDEALKLATANSASITASKLNSQQAYSLSNLPYQPGTTGFNYSNEAIFQEGPQQLHEFSLSQQIVLPRVQNSRNQVQQSIAAYRSVQTIQTQALLHRDIRELYCLIHQKKMLLKTYQSLLEEYQFFLHIAQQRVQLDEANKIESLTVEMEYQQLALIIEQTTQELQGLERAFSVLINSGVYYTTGDDFETLTMGMMDLTLTEAPAIQLANSERVLAEAQKAQLKTAQLPRFSLGYLLQRIPDTGWYNGFGAGIQWPLFSNNIKKKVQAQQLAVEAKNELVKATELSLQQEIAQAISLRMSFEKGIELYDAQLKNINNELIRVSQLNYENGEISYLAHLQSLRYLWQTQERYQAQILGYNRAVIRLEYLMGR